MRPPISVAARDTAGLKCPPLSPTKAEGSLETKVWAGSPKRMPSWHPRLALQGRSESRTSPEWETGTRSHPFSPMVGQGMWVRAGEERAAPFLTYSQAPGCPEEEHGG